jgi:hypothetical protein
VAEAVRDLVPDVDVQHVSTWQEGAHINAADDMLLEACWQDGRALVSKDRATLPGWIALRVADGREHGGVLFYDLERFKAHQIGALDSLEAWNMETWQQRLSLNGCTWSGTLQPPV